MDYLDLEKKEKMEEAIRRSGKVFVLLGIVDLITFSTFLMIFYLLGITMVPLLIFVILIIAAIGLIIWGRLRMRGPSKRSI